MSDREQFFNNFKFISNKFAQSISVYYVREFDSSFGITYFDLNRVSCELSNYFLRVFEEGPKYIGISLSDYFFLPCLILGVWKSGFSFAGVSKQYSRKDTLNYLNFLNVRYLISDNSDEYDGEIIYQFYIHKQKFFIFNLRISNKGFKFKNDICYGIMTSGTTGKPKIIQVPWSCILPNAVELVNECQIEDTDCIFQASPYTFDPFFIEFFMALLSGCSLMIVSNVVKLSSTDLLRVLFTPSENIILTDNSCELVNENFFFIDIKQRERPNISVLQMTPSIFKRWTEYEIKNSILSPSTKLRILILGGEKFPQEILHLKCSGNTTRIFNIYGITEVSCWAFLNEVTSSHSTEVSLGKVLDNIVYKISEDGEFHVGSKTRICLVDEESSIDVDSPVFRNTGDIVRLHNGEIHYVGRKNQIVKKYGMKINLSKIEEAFMRRNKLAKDCYCVYDERNLKLGLFYVPTVIDERESNYLVVLYEDFCKKGYQIPKDELNDIEVPDYLIELSRVPINSHGKCHRVELLQFLMGVSKVSNPELGLESIFQRIWGEVLSLEKFESDSLSFIELGGNSVLSLDLINKLEDLGLTVPRNFITELLGGGNYESCLKCLRSVLDQSEIPRKKLKIDEDVFNANDINLSIRWKFDLEKCVDATPTVFEYQGKDRVVVGSHSSKLTCLDFDSGEEIWTISLGDRIESGFRVSREGYRGFVGCYDYFAYCIALSDGGIIWKFKTGDMVKSTPCLSTDEKIVYVPSYDKHLYCLSAVDGQVLTKLKLSNGGIYSTGTISHSLGDLYIGTLDGTCAAVDQKTNDIKWKKVLKSPIFASPCFIESKSQILFTEVLGVVYCFDATNGTKMWVYKVNGNVYSSPIVHVTNDVNNIIFGCHDHHLYSLLYVETPELKWRRQLDSPVFTRPSTSSHPPWLVCTATTKGVIYLCDFVSGLIKARFKLAGEVFSSVINYKNRLIVGCRDNNVYALDISST